MPNFSAQSQKQLAKLMSPLQVILIEAIKEVDFKILDATRGKAAQEKAFKEGKSHAHFGQSAHNYEPAVAVDLFPAPYDWKDIAAFKKLGEVIKRIAKEKGIPIRWGGDWKSLKDYPHFELDPWRVWAKKSKLYEGQ